MRVSRFMRVVDSYARQMGRSIASISDQFPEITGPQDPYPHLLAGKFDLDAGIGRCVTCDKVKRLSQFNKDSHSPWGRRSRCRLCQADHLRKQPPVRKQCSRCGKLKNLLTDYYKSGTGDDGPSGYMSMCKNCKDGKLDCLVCEERKKLSDFPNRMDKRDICGECRTTRKAEVELQLVQYKCRQCGERKYMDAFPAAKKDSPKSNFACLECDGKAEVATVESLGGYLCRVCGERKRLALFPPAKTASPQMMIACISCALGGD
jgi:hypothetical protein